MIKRLTSSIGSGVVRVTPVEDDFEDEYIDLESGSAKEKSILSREKISSPLPLRLPLDQMTPVDETPPETGSTKCPPTGGRRRRNSSRQRPSSSRKNNYQQQIFSPAGQSLAERMSRNQRLLDEKNARVNEAVNFSGSSEGTHIFNTEKNEREVNRIDSITAGLGKRLNRRTIEKKPNPEPNKHTAVASSSSKFATLQEEKHRRAARRREANRLTRLVKQAATIAQDEAIVNIIPIATEH